MDTIHWYEQYPIDLLMLIEQERFQMYSQSLLLNKQEEKVMMYLEIFKEMTQNSNDYSSTLPLADMRTAQRVLSVAIGCFMRSLIVEVELLLLLLLLRAEKFRFGYLKRIFFN